MTPVGGRELRGYAERHKKTVLVSTKFSPVAYEADSAPPELSTVPNPMMFGPSRTVNVAPWLIAARTEGTIMVEFSDPYGWRPASFMR
jgi:hypothetical protein